ncbi:MAG: hypothetical protein ACI9VS_001566, partial [Candidatus Binatia bacterium]
QTFRRIEFSKSDRLLEPKVGQPLSRKANLGLEGVIPLG